MNNNNLLIKLPSIIIQQIFNSIDEDIDRVFLYSTCKQLNQKKYLWLDSHEYDCFSSSRHGYGCILLDRFKRIKITLSSEYDDRLLNRLIRCGDECIVEELDIIVRKRDLPPFGSLLLGQHPLPRSITSISISILDCKMNETACEHLFNICRSLPWDRLVSFGLQFSEPGPFDQYTKGLMEILEQDNLPLQRLSINFPTPRLFTRLPTTLQHLILDNYKSSTFLQPSNRRIQIGQLPKGLIKLVTNEIKNEDIIAGALPDSLTDLTIKNLPIIPFPPGFLPPHLKTLFMRSQYVSGHYSDTLNVTNLPSTLESLKTNVILGPNSVLPDGLKHLSVQSIRSSTILPSTLQSIEITGSDPFRGTLPHSLVKYDGYNNKQQPFTTHLPTNIQHLSFGNFSQVIQSNTLPSTLTHIDLGHEYNQPIGVGVLPQSLQSLTLSYKYNHVFQIGSLPCNLTILDLSISSYNHPLEQGVLPSTLKQLILSRVFNQPMKVGDLPCSLELLKFSGYFNRIFDQNVLPNSLTSLSFLSDYHRPLSYLPSSLLHLYLHLSTPRIINFPPSLIIFYDTHCRLRYYTIDQYKKIMK